MQDNDDVSEDHSQPRTRYTFSPDVDSGSSHGIMLDLVGHGRDVLDVGCAGGDLARALRLRGCRVTGIEYDPVAAEAARPDLEHLVIGDLETMDLAEALGDRRFDAVVLGDVLEHLRDPAAVLRQVPGVLRPGGSVVVSIPNVAHASVRLSLLNGDFTYRSTGLLDETHLRFFTRESVMQLLEQAGLVAVDVRRTVLGPFDGEIPLSPEDVPPDVLDRVMQDPEAITYQFVLEAVVDDAEGRVRSRTAAAARDRAAADEAQAQIGELQHALNTLRDEHAGALDRLAETAGELARIQEALADESHLRRASDRGARRLRREAAERDAALEAVRQELAAQQEATAAAQADAQARAAALSSVYGSTAWRVSAPVRALGPLRAAVQGPVQNRRSLRRAGALKAAARSVQTQGVRATVERVRQELAAGDGRAAYEEWLDRYGTPSAEDEGAIRRHVDEALADGPLISVVVPVYDTDPDLLRAAVDSVRAQLYPRWELCLADDCSPAAQTRVCLDEVAGSDERIRVHRRTTNGGIARATNDALAMATGEFVAFMDHDDLLAPHALYLVAAELAEHPDADLLYSDEDKIDADGRRYDPHFKPDFDPELLLGQNYISHLTVMRRTLVDELGGLDVAMDGSQDHDLVLRATERTTASRIRHLPWVLYHWRQWSGSGTFSSRRLMEATAASRAAVGAHLERRGEVGAEVVPCPQQPGWNRVLRRPPSPLPAVTAVIPTRDRLSLLRPCVEGLLRDTDYSDLHILIADNDSSEPEMLTYLRRVAQDPRVTVLPAPGPFNYSRINNLAVAQVQTPLVLLLNNDIVVRDQDWLTEMVTLLQVPGTGAVGAKLLYGDGRVQHAGVILGIGGVAGHSHKYFPGSSTGYFGRLVLNQTVSAATAACLLLRTETYQQVGGLNEQDLAVAFNDVDLCLRVGEAGHRISFAATAVLDHLESASRGAEVTPEQVARFNAEADWMRHRWAHRLYDDPAYNPNLTDVHEDFSLAARPRVSRPWQDRLR